MVMYQLNTAKAKDADGSVYSKITDPGAYTGKITLAKAIVAKSGARGVEMTFEREDGATANYLTIYTFNSDGKEIFGLNQLNALMTCLKVREISSENIEVEEYSATTGYVQKVMVEAFKGLMNKSIGLVLDVESYTNKKGEQKTTMVYKSCFDASTRQTASEILSREPASRIDKIVERLINKPAPITYQNTHQQQKSNGYQPQAEALEFDDDFPF